MESLRIDHRLNKPHEKRKRQEIRNQWELKKKILNGDRNCENNKETKNRKKKNGNETSTRNKYWAKR